MPTVVLKCNCDNEKQDVLHGAKMRVHNQTSNPNVPTFRCTVCGVTRSLEKKREPKK